MATTTKANTFTAGTTILSADVNENFDDIYNDYNGNITNANVSASAAIVDTKLAQITTGSKVSGLALTALGDIPTQTETTKNSLNIVNDSNTSGGLAVFSSNSSSTLSRTLVAITNDNTAASQAAGLTIQQDATTDSFLITHTAVTGIAFKITASQTTANVGDVTANSLTTGVAFDLNSSTTAMTGIGRMFFSDHTGTGSVSGIINEFETAATDETILLQASTTSALTGTILNVTSTAVATGTLLRAGDADALTSGKIVDFESNSSDTSARNLVTINNDNTAAVSANPLRIQQDAEFIFADFVGSSGATSLDAVSTLNTSGATTDHIRIRVNGVDAWIAVSTATPSA